MIELQLAECSRRQWNNRFDSPTTVLLHSLNRTGDSVILTHMSEHAIHIVDVLYSVLLSGLCWHCLSVDQCTAVEVPLASAHWQAGLVNRTTTDNNFHAGYLEADVITGKSLAGAGAGGYCNRQSGPGIPEQIETKSTRNLHLPSF
jgi:hypothetical protein